MNEELKADAPDARYIAICARCKEVGDSIQEEVFQLIETAQDACDFEPAYDLIDTLVKLDRVYTLSLKRGMAITEAKKKEWEKTPEGQAALKAQMEKEQAEIDRMFAEREKLRQLKEAEAKEATPSN